jgi:hypothetical protein
MYKSRTRCGKKEQLIQRSVDPEHRPFWKIYLQVWATAISQLADIVILAVTQLK